MQDKQTNELFDVLMYFYEQGHTISKINTKPRKKTIQNKNGLYFYTHNCGMSYLLFSFIKNTKQNKYIYIDLNDKILQNRDFANLIKNINIFANEYKISLIIIDHISTLEPIILDNNLIYVLCTTIQNQTKSYDCYKTFHKEIIYPTDYNEYSFFKKTQKAQIFNSFIKDSSFINIFLQDNYLQRKNLQNYIHHYLRNKTHIETYYMYLQYQAQQTSIYFVFQRLKKTFKISKDKFYLATQELIDLHMMFFVKHIFKKSRNSKVYFIDHNMPKALQIKNSLKNSLENALFLELIKKDNDAKSIFYDDDLTFIIPNKGIGFLLVVFKELEEIIDEIWYLDTILEEYKLNTIKLITINEDIENYEKILNEKKYEVVKFWDI